MEELEEREQKPSIAFLNQQAEEWLITNVRGNVEMNSSETPFNGNREGLITNVRGNVEMNSSVTPFNENREVMDSQIPGQYDDKDISEEKIRELIKTIQRYPALYDPRHPHFHCDSVMRNRIWEEVAKQAKFSDVQEAQRKWRSLCDHYMKILRIQKDQPIQDVAGRRQWIYINEMKFIENILKNSKKRPASSSDSEAVPGSSSSKESLEKQLGSLENTNNMIMEYLQKKMKDKTEEKQDSLAVFFQSMEDLVRTFSKARQLDVKCKLSSIVFGAEAEEMKERSGKPNNNAAAVPMNFSTPGPSSNMYLNPNIPIAVPYQNSNVYPPPYPTQLYPPQQNCASKVFSHQYAALPQQTVKFHQRMSKVLKQ